MASQLAALIICIGVDGVGVGCVGVGGVRVVGIGVVLELLVLLAVVGFGGGVSALSL